MIFINYDRYVSIISKPSFSINSLCKLDLEELVDFIKFLEKQSVGGEGSSQEDQIDSKVIRKQVKKL